MKGMSRWMITAAAFLIGIAGGSGLDAWRSGTAADGTAERPAGEAVSVLAQPLDVQLTRTYQCGIRDEERQRWTEGSMEQLLTRFSGWEVVSVQGSSVTLHKWENDIAPMCKQNGYFGLLPDGTLALFNGVPEKGQVIQTFYPINQKQMEASLPKEEVEWLHKGIRVRDLAEYNSVLSTYGDFQTASPGAGDGH